MAVKLKRSAKSARKAAVQRGKAARIKAARRHGGSLLDRVFGWVPLSDAQLHRCFVGAIFCGVLGAAWVLAVMAGVPGMVHQHYAQLAGASGFEVRKVTVRGVNHLNELKVYERVLAERDRAMPLVDVTALREKLLELSWVEDARVSRQLPDTLVVDIIERKAHAVLRKPDHLVLIDAKGHELEPISAARVHGRMVLSGPGAGLQVAALADMINAAPALRPQVAEAEWIGNRRWNLTFKTGQVLALPEGKQASANALMSFARMDGANRLLGGKVVAFDMRAPDRIYLRLPEHVDAAQLAVPPVVKAQP